MSDASDPTVATLVERRETLEAEVERLWDIEGMPATTHEAPQP
jgi:hypothetical protein